MTTERLSAAIVTPSFSLDLERCELLVDSLGVCAPQLAHYVIVDRRDIPVFRHLQSRRTHIIESESLISASLHRLPFKRGYWVSWKGLVVRGWIMQQIMKIAAANVLPEDVLIYCDSDVVFFRWFDLSAALISGKIGLLDTAFKGGSVPEWTNVASRLLGVSAGVPPRGHVGNMICWHGETVRAMQRHLEHVSGRPWQHAIARQRAFSEYVLYGIFVREVLGYDNSPHLPSEVPLIKPSWGLDLSTPAQMKEFLSEFHAQTLGVMVHSKDEISLPQLRASLARKWASAAQDVTNSA